MKKFPLIAAAIFTCLVSYSQSKNLELVYTFHIKSDGWWDYIAVRNDKLYVSHGNQVNILDASRGDSLGVILNTPGVHGIAFDQTAKGFTSNGRSNNVTVFNTITNEVITQIQTGQNPDAIMYEPYTRTIITCNGGSHDLSVIDPNTEKVIQTIPVGGKPETAVTDKEGNVFVNIEDKNEIAKVNMKTFSVEARWPLAGGESPTGLAIDPGARRLYSGCDKQLVILDLDNGNVVTKLPIGDGCDGVVFNGLIKMIYTANGEGTITVIKKIDANNFSVLENFPTKRGARTITMDMISHFIYLPTADFDKTKTDANGRPVMIPGSFQVLALRFI
jgi:YVTN family beta-propeller protein